MKEKVNDLAKSLSKGLIVSMYEPCDCYERYGRILHNNGGNYHQIVHFKLIKPNLIRVRFDSTADFGLLPEEEPIYVNLQEAIEFFEELLEQNYWYSVYRPGE